MNQTILLVNSSTFRPDNVLIELGGYRDRNLDRGAGRLEIGGRICFTKPPTGPVGWQMHSDVSRRVGRPLQGVCSFAEHS